MTSFRLLQISDLHFSGIPNHLSPAETAITTLRRSQAVFKDMVRRRLSGGILRSVYPSSFNPDVALELSRLLSKEMVRHDALIVTGDLATTGERDDLAIAHEYFLGIYPSDWMPYPASGPNLLKNEDDAVLTLPGNHDRYQGVALLPASKDYEGYFGPCWDFMREYAYDLCSPVAKSRTKVCLLHKDDACLAVVMADLSLDDANSGEGAKGYIGQGRVTLRRLGEMISATEQVRKEAADIGAALGIVWAVHYPPCYPDIERDLELQLGEALIEAAADAGVSAILAGHTHCALRYTARSKDKCVEVFCCGSTTGIGVEADYSFSRLEFDVAATGVQIKATQDRWHSHIRGFVPGIEIPVHTV